MGNACKCVCRQTDEDEAADALLDGFNPQHSRPRGPPPPYQVEAPLYALSEEQRVQLVQRVTMIQSLPLGRYDVGEDKKDKTAMLEPSEEVQGCEKKGEMDRECAICMVDFVEGEPIRLLPCMHFYHMRCIDEWLMRSYCCPSCMERVDEGMLSTLTSSSSPVHTGLRRRRRRRDRGSTSSMGSVGNVGARGVERAVAKRREGTQFVPVSQHTDHPSSGQAASASGQAIHQMPSEQGVYSSGQVVHPARQAVRSSGQVPIHRHMNFLTDLSTSGHSAGSGQVEGASGGQDHDVYVLNHPELEEFGDLAYSMDQVAFCDFQNARDQMSPRAASSATGAVSPPPNNTNTISSSRFSPPVFEYHFEYPTPPTTVTEVEYPSFSGGASGRGKASCRDSSWSPTPPPTTDTQ